MHTSSLTKNALQGEVGPSGSAAFPRVSGADVLVVIPTLNEAGHIEACLKSLMDGDDRLNSAHFVVADGGSRDATCAIVEGLKSRYPNLSLIHNPKKLQSAAVNLGARLLGGDKTVLVRCDAHSIYPRNYVMDIADVLIGMNVQSIVTPMDAEGVTCFQRANAWVVDTPLGSGGSAHRGGLESKFVDHGHHAGFRVDSFLAVGGYDETFSHNEDAEFDRRLAKAGGRIFLDASIRIRYRPRPTPLSLARQYFNYGKGRARNLVKHREIPRPRQMVPVAVLLGVVGGFALAPVWIWTLLAPAAYGAILLVASLGMAAKKKSACGLLSGLAAGVMHLSWALGFLKQLGASMAGSR